MVSLTKKELDRIRHVNDMKRRVNNRDDLRLVYYSGANLVLLKFIDKDRWGILDETGRWFEDLFDYVEIQ